MEKELTAREVRNLPEMSKVTVHGRDKYGYPTRMLCFVHTVPGGKRVLRPIALFADGFIEIRKGVRYTMEGSE